MKVLKLIAAAGAMVMLISCADEVKPPPEAEFEFVRRSESIPPELPSSAAENDGGYEPLNYSEPTGMWFPYMDYAEYMQGKSENEFRRLVRERFTAAAEKSVNTVYLHVHPCGDAYYSSDIFPSGTYLDGEYDPLEIMLEEAHELGLSVHAWLNPLRCQTVEQMKSLPEDFIVKKWTQTSAGTLVNTVNGRWYLNPACEEVIDLICRAVDEIVRNYDVDGVHIDDYFYPTTSTDFDKSSFEASGHSDLTQWRLANCNRLVHAMYESVKRVDSNILFGISPQGNIDANYSSQYADVREWTANPGYCDYIVPQIYYGFLNETCPFEETLAEWEKMVSCDRISLIIGLAAYKQNAHDKWAGAAGENEWIENPDLLQQQIECVKSSSAQGYALYY